MYRERRRKSRTDITMKFIKTIRDIFSIPELKNRILNTLLFIVVYRLGTFVLLPGVDRSKIGDTSGGLLDFLDHFVGGAFSNKSIFGLGIMPYISASIVIQLGTVAIPYFQRLQKEGESGRKKLNQITRVLTIAICLVQSFGFIQLILNDDKGLLMQGVDPTFFMIQSFFILTAGTVFCMWLGERITEKGVGNGISMLIMIGIISRLPNSILQEWTIKGGMAGGFVYVLEILALFFIVMGVVMLTQATRQIPVNYAKQVINNKVYGGQKQYIPLKVNSAGVMPIIFAQSLMFIPGLIANSFTGEDNSAVAAWIATNLGNFNAVGYNVLFAVLIIAFTYFYTAITIQPNSIADDLKRNGGFIPGVKPGLETGEYIDDILSKITLPGALFIAIVAVLPAFASRATVGDGLAQFFGGTSLLIMVGVVLDTLQQIESYLLMKQYEGMMKSGKVKGRQGNVAVA